jgi:hypothetical protein
MKLVLKNYLKMRSLKNSKQQPLGLNLIPKGRFRLPTDLKLNLLS